MTGLNRRNARAGWILTVGLSAPLGAAQADSVIGTPAPVPSAIGVATPDAAAEAPDFFVLGDRLATDNNLYRLPASITDLTTLIGPGATRSDRINTAFLGGQTRWRPGTQLIHVDGEVDYNDFERNSVLDNWGGRGSLYWDWASGQIWTGAIGANVARALTSFANNRIFLRDLYNTDSYYGTARLQVHSGWFLTGEARETDTTHTAQPQQFNDVHRTLGQAGIEYFVDQDDRIGVEEQRARSSFPYDAFVDGRLFVRTYTEDVSRLHLRRDLSGQVLLDATAGYLRRSYSDSSVARVSGDIWQALLQWQPSANVRLSLAGGRDIHAYLDAESNSFVVRSVRATANWAASSIVTLGIDLGWEHQDYVAEPGLAPLTPLRRDHLASQRFDVSLQLSEGWALDLAAAIEKRDSNRSELSYSDTVLGATLSYRF